MSFKGTTPADFYDRYNCEGGQWNLEMDLLVAAEIADRVNEQTDNVTKADKAKGAVARRSQRKGQRQQLSNNKGFFEALRDSGVPIRGAKSGEKNG